MIELTAGFEIMNPEHHICTLDKGAKLEVEFIVENGKGYIPANSNNLLLFQSIVFLLTVLWPSYLLS